MDNATTNRDADVDLLQLRALMIEAQRKGIAVDALSGTEKDVLMAHFRPAHAAYLIDLVAAGPQLIAGAVPASADNPSTAGAATADYVLMPKGLTAENGAKGALSGEFHEYRDIECPECLGDGDDSYGEECPECEGMGKAQERVTVEWDTIKRIYASAVDLLAAPAAQAPVDQDGERWRFMMRAGDDFNGPEADLMNEFTEWSTETYGNREKDKRPQSVILTEVVDKARAKFAEQSALRTASKDQSSALGEKGGDDV